MERETGFEPATSTLARSHSTTELFPLIWSAFSNGIWIVCQYKTNPFCGFIFTLTLQKPEGFRVKAPEGEVVVFYFEPSATQEGFTVSRDAGPG
jgi:hypothetical protein